MIMARSKNEQRPKPVKKQPPTVRVTERCKSELEALARELDMSQTEVVEKVIFSYRRSNSLKLMEADYEAIAADAKASKILAEENAVFDGLIEDGTH